MAGKIGFTERENEIIGLLLQGKSNKQMALALGVSVRTVEFHLSNIYAQLGVSSRTEAVLELSEVRLREAATRELRESTVAADRNSGENAGTSVLRRRSPMKPIAYLLAGILLTTFVIWLLLPRPAASAPTATRAAVSTPSVAAATPSETSTPETATKEHILAQIRQLAAQYDQAVQAEKNNGHVTFGKDPRSGKDNFTFTGDSFVRIYNLFLNVNDQINQLSQLYVQVYQDETHPTPFPTASSAEESQAYLQSLYEGFSKECPALPDVVPNATFMMYEPSSGIYLPRLYDDAWARCEVLNQMIEEFRTAPSLAKVNKEADMALIRRILGKADLALSFQSVGENGNDGGRNDAIYTDGAGTQYYIDIETGRLASIQSGFPGHPSVTAVEAKSLDELRRLARQFALANSPRLTSLEPVLSYEEGSKGERPDAIYFFDWRYTSKDWSGTDWAMMPPFLQIGMLANGQIVTYFDSLDLFR